MLRRSAGLARRTAPVLTGTLLALGATVPLVSPALACTGKRVVDAVLAHQPLRAAGWVAAELALILAQLGAARGLVTVRALLGSRLAVAMSALLARTATRLPCSLVESAEYQDRLARAQREPAGRAVTVVGEALTVLQGALALGIYAVILLRFSPWIGALLLLSALPVALVELRAAAEQVAAQDERTPEQRRAQYLEGLLLRPEHAREVRLLGLQESLLQRSAALGTAFYQADRRLQLGALWPVLSAAALAPLTFYGSYGVLALLAARGQLSLGDLTLLAIAFHQAQMTLRAMVAAAKAGHEGALQLAGFFDFLALAGDDAAPARRRAAKVAGAPVLRCEDLGFRYPGATGWALRHVSFSLPAGQSLAILGGNGSGKTTLVKLLTGLYEPTEGRVLLDGVDLRDWEPAALRARFGVLFQDFARFQLSLRENLEAGLGGDALPEDALRAALRLAGADALPQALPRGLDTQLGKHFEHGVELSGGQWQKVALARVLTRTAADLLVLDEPTAALDGSSQRLVFDRVRAMAGGRTVILISHHPDGVKLADRVLSLEGGRVVSMTQPEAQGGQSHDAAA